MLTKKENLLETINGGNPDRFVNQYEFLDIILEAPLKTNPKRGETVKNEWGITFSWPEDQIGQFPLHDDEHRVLKDITKWKETITKPSVKYSDERWQAAIDHANKVDRNDKYVTVFWAPGLFEMCHHLMGMEDAMMSFYEDPDDLRELIDYLVEHQIEYAKEIIPRLQPNALFHHDDWGGQISTFFSPDMFKDFFVEPYKRLYGFWRDNGIELIVHHSDSYAATLVPHMIDIGIDIWQGVMTTNDTPALIKNYGEKISFMGDIDSGVVDTFDWSPEVIAENVEKACQRCGKHYFIPCLTQGLGFSSFPGVYDEATRVIHQLSKKMFG